ncbi:MAG: helix-turn-helix domain-containing protein [Clostridia bacterium]|nr:helix-turn-helix domain-containing protein [Clostridia bacterium]
MNIDKLVTVKTIENKDFSDEKHTPYSAEIRLLSCVQQGDIESLIAQLKNLDSIIVMGRMSDDELRQCKYMAVSTITLATRYAIQGGLNENKAYEFSDRVIKTIDRLDDKDEIFMCLGAEIVKLTEDVKKNKKQPEFSPHIRNCIKYINENISRKISVSAIAEHCGISADYLSQIFKKEIGENLSSYILRQKLEKAKGLLLDGMSSGKISAQLGFSSQTYFITAFKKFYKMTPSDYVKLAKTT